MASQINDSCHGYAGSSDIKEGSMTSQDTVLCVSRLQITLAVYYKGCFCVISQPVEFLRSSYGFFFNLYCASCNGWIMYANALRLSKYDQFSPLVICLVPNALSISKVTSVTRSEMDHFFLTMKVSRDILVLIISTLQLIIPKSGDKMPM